MPIRRFQECTRARSSRACRGVQQEPTGACERPSPRAAPQYTVFPREGIPSLKTNHTRRWNVAQDARHEIVPGRAGVERRRVARHDIAFLRERAVLACHARDHDDIELGLGTEMLLAKLFDLRAELGGAARSLLDEETKCLRPELPRDHEQLFDRSFGVWTGRVSEP